MARMRALRFTLGLGVLLPACGDEGITGRWHGDLPGADVTLTVEQKDEDVFGSVEILQMASEARGSVKDEWVELAFPQLDGAVHYEAGLQGDEVMTGTWTMGGIGEKLTLKRLR